MTATNDNMTQGLERDTATILSRVVGGIHGAVPEDESALMPMVFEPAALVREADELRNAALAAENDILVMLKAHNVQRQDAPHDIELCLQNLTTCMTSLNAPSTQQPSLLRDRVKNAKTVIANSAVGLITTAEQHHEQAEQAAFEDEHPKVLKAAPAPKRRKHGHGNDSHHHHHSGFALHSDHRLVSGSSWEAAKVAAVGVVQSLGHGITYMATGLEDGARDMWAQAANARHSEWTALKAMGHLFTGDATLLKAGVTHRAVQAGHKLGTIKDIAIEGVEGLGDMFVKSDWLALDFDVAKLVHATNRIASGLRRDLIGDHTNNELDKLLPLLERNSWGVIKDRHGHDVFGIGQGHLTSHHIREVLQDHGITLKLENDESLTLHQMVELMRQVAREEQQAKALAEKQEALAHMTKPIMLTLHDKITVNDIPSHQHLGQLSVPASLPKLPKAKPSLAVA